nr:hypothetical protein [Acidisoma sp. PAMC 29798]
MGFNIPDQLGEGIGRGVFLVWSGRHRFFSPPGSLYVERSIPNNTGQPSPGIAALRVKRRRMRPDLQQRVMHSVSRQVCVIRDAHS